MGLMSMKAGLARLVRKHGPELATCAKVATSVLIPGGGVLAEAVGHMCDHVARHGDRDDVGLTQMIAQLGDDQDHVLKLLSHMESRLDQTLAQMSRARQGGVDEEQLRGIMEAALAQNPALMEVRQELLKLQPEIKLIQAQNESMLKQQAFAGEMLSQVKDQVNAALSFCQPMMSEGLIGQDAARFMAAHQRFQQSLLAQDWGRVQTCLSEMKTLAPHGATVQVCEMAVKAIHKDFAGAEQNLQAAMKRAPLDPALRAASRSLTSLTRSSRPSSLSALDNLAPSSSSHPSQGQSIGDKGWTLQALLGRGGMGEVWKSVNMRQTEGALKLMLPSLSDDPAFVQRFRGEIDALMKVKHPNIIEILDWGRDHRTSSWYFVTRYIEGQSLTSRLRSEALSETQAREVFGALARGLQVCHQAGVVHRDIKPDNIMMTQSGDPILIDFGIALQDSSGGQTQMATLSYAPPEQLAGGRVGPEADIYALGRTLLEALGGWDMLSDDLSQVVDRITHDNPKKRGDAHQLIQDLLGEAPRYYLIINGGEPQGPLGVSAAADELLAHQGSHHVWCEGMEGWSPWGSVEEVAQRVAKLKASRRSKSPPPPPPLGALGGLSALGSSDSTQSSMGSALSSISTAGVGARTASTSPLSALASHASSVSSSPSSSPSLTTTSPSVQPEVTQSAPIARPDGSSASPSASSPWTQGKTQFEVRAPRAGSIAARVAQQSGLDARACAIGVRCLVDVLIKDLKKCHATHIYRLFQVRYIKSQDRVSWRVAPSLKTMVRDQSAHLVQPLAPQALEPNTLARWAPSASRKIGQEYAGKFVKGLSTRRRLAWCVHVESKMPLHWAIQLVHAWEWVITERLVKGETVQLTGLGKLSVSNRDVGNPRTGQVYSLRVISQRVSPKLIYWLWRHG